MKYPPIGTTDDQKQALLSDTDRTTNTANLEPFFTAEDAEYAEKGKTIN
jgi:hypothetical protein